MQLVRTNACARPAASRAARPQRLLVVRTQAFTTTTKKDLPPSSRTGANELEALQSLSTVVPDMALFDANGAKPAAATVSANLLSSVLAAQKLGLTPIKNAIVAALSYDRCAGLKGAAKLECCLDKALVNVAALLLPQLAEGGRVAINVDVRLANDTNALVAKVKSLSALCTESGLPSSRLLWRLPATWAAIQAAKQLEASGHTTQVYFVFSLAQAVAAMQAGASVLQTSVGTTREWYLKHPGAIRDPKGPREDSGCGSGVDPGTRLVREVYAYARAHSPSTRIMASGIRTRDDALAVSGVDFILLPSHVAAALARTATVQGYNDGLHAAAGTDTAGLTPALTPALAAEMNMPKSVALDESLFHASLGPSAEALTAAGLKVQAGDVQVLLNAMASLATGME